MEIASEVSSFVVFCCQPTNVTLLSRKASQICFDMSFVFKYIQKIPIALLKVQMYCTLILLQINWLHVTILLQIKSTHGKDFRNG